MVHTLPPLCVPTLLSQLSPSEDLKLQHSFTRMGEEAVTSITEYFLSQSHPDFTQQPAWVNAGRAESMVKKP